MFLRSKMPNLTLTGQKRYVLSSFQILLIFLMLFAGARVFAQQFYYYDTFEGYDLGLISEQEEHWTGLSEISDTQAYSGFQSLKLHELDYTIFTLGAPTTTDFYWNFYFYFHPTGEVVANTFTTLNASGDEAGLYMSIYRYYDDYKIRFFEGGDYVYLGNFEPDQWNYLELYYNVPNKKIQANLNKIEWREFETIYEIPDIAKIRMSSINVSAYLDNFEVAWTGELEYPTLPLKFPFETWLGYYQAKSEKFTEPTVLFTSIAGAFSPIADKMGEISLYIKNLFNPLEASAKGTQLGQAIPTARGYLGSIDSFFGGLPLSTFFLFYLVVIGVIITYKVVLQIIHIIKP
jgi:hypothetical protein